TAAAAFVAGAAPASAATFNVTNNNTSGAGSLADAIHQANLDTGTADEIDIASGLNIPVNAGDLEKIAGPVTIAGAGAATTTITRQTASRIFYIDASSATFNVTISGLTLTHNGTQTSGSGGAVKNVAGHVMISDSVITGNDASGRGGGVQSTGD